MSQRGARRPGERDLLARGCLDHMAAANGATFLPCRPQAKVMSPEAPCQRLFEYDEGRYRTLVAPPSLCLDDPSIEQSPPCAHRPGGISKGRTFRTSGPQGIEFRAAIRNLTLRIMKRNSFGFGHCDRATVPTLSGHRRPDPFAEFHDLRSTDIPS